MTPNNDTFRRMPNGEPLEYLPTLDSGDTIRVTPTYEHRPAQAFTVEAQLSAGDTIDLPFQIDTDGYLLTRNDTHYYLTTLASDTSSEHHVVLYNEEIAGAVTIQNIRLTNE